MTKKGITPQQAKDIRDKKGLAETILQKLRVEKGLSQTALAAVTGVSQRTIQCYEQRTRPIDGARLDTLCDISYALGCKIEDILEDKALIEKYRLSK